MFQALNMRQDNNSFLSMISIPISSCEGIVYCRVLTKCSEQSDECIDFTMICVFFLSVDNIWSSKNASIFDFSPSLKRKLNLVGTLGGQKLKFFNIFEMNREKPQKNEGKTGFFTQNQFTSKSNFLFCYKSKTNRCKYLKFSPNVYISALHTQQLKFSIFLIVLKVIKKNPKSSFTIFFYECLKFEFIRNMSKLRKFQKFIYNKNTYMFL
ncbi:hypothetical protein AGLY_008700 [Aphis glycines]|uniref:Uncharacterized protein n=1 Tax=Aphis glycines TaxID=307491 RepID=A0A6G0TKL1_APHGL|nr:hypothetical protein AGLY_008700 [Aphis glycines]